MLEARPRPSHVPPELVVDFDYFDLPGGKDDIQLAWKKVQETCPRFFWTPRNGGHWVATRAQDMDDIFTDFERFSSRHTRIPAIKTPYPLLPLELDPPEHAAYRALLIPSFSPKAVSILEANVRKVAISVIEELAPGGECEFITQFAKVLPIHVFLDIMGLPRTDAKFLLPHADALARASNPADNLEARKQISGYMQKRIDERRKNFGDDPLSRILNGKINGETITDMNALGLCTLVLAAGLDTVAGMLGCTARFLALSPEHRKRIVDDPSVIPKAVDELIRRHGIVNNARIVANDMDYKGVALKAGDQVQVANVLFGLDEEINSDPLTVDFDRAMPKHAAFGIGRHVCPGANLARRELAVFLEEWLKRIPDFQIKPGTTPVMVMGAVNGIQELQLSWTPARG